MIRKLKERISGEQADTDLIQSLKAFDMPTICNAIAVAQGQRGFNPFSKGTLFAALPEAEPIVGLARTAKVAGVSPSAEPADVLKSRRMEYFRSIAAGPLRAVAVVEDIDFPNCIGAWWGEVHGVVHKNWGSKVL